MKFPVEDHWFMYCADPEKATALFCALLMEECGGDAVRLGEDCAYDCGPVACGYDLTNHHHALADAEDCAHIALKIL